MQILVLNTVRDPSTLEIRRSFPGEVVPAPLIAGLRLPPRRSRILDSAILSDADIETLILMSKVGVLKVFRQVPLTPLSEQELRSWKREKPEARIPESTAPTSPAPALIEQEAPASVEEATADEPSGPPEPSEPAPPSLKDELSVMRLPGLRAKLTSLGGTPGSLSKEQLISAILERQS